jgi:hypothetical protein
MEGELNGSPFFIYVIIFITYVKDIKIFRIFVV